MKLVVDMNLSPEWCPVLASQGWRACRLGPLVIATIREYTAELEAGALITLDEGRARVRILPIRPRGDEG